MENKRQCPLFPLVSSSFRARLFASPTLSTQQMPSERRSHPQCFHIFLSVPLFSSSSTVSVYLSFPVVSQPLLALSRFPPLSCISPPAPPPTPPLWLSRSLHLFFCSVADSRVAAEDRLLLRFLARKKGLRFRRLLCSKASLVFSACSARVVRWC